MPKGPQGQKRPADVIGAAVKVMRIATGEIEESAPTMAARSKAGKIGGKRRAEALPENKRRQIAQKAARARWGNKSG
jgi:hypothetical protein